MSLVLQKCGGNTKRRRGVEMTDASVVADGSMLKCARDDIAWWMIEGEGGRDLVWPFNCRALYVTISTDFDCHVRVVGSLLSASCLQTFEDILRCSHCIIYNAAMRVKPFGFSPNARHSSVTLVVSNPPSRECSRSRSHLSSSQSR